MNQYSTQHYLLTGHVQGVGFRPYVYRLATQHGLVGWVRNLAGQVEIKVQGTDAALQIFADNLIKNAPPLARPHIISCTPGTTEKNFTEFKILTSETATESHVQVPPDYFTCTDCLQELHDPLDRRYRYPFINCTQCGPRYTLIHRLPYDRPNTSMADFPLCPECLAEYENPGDRRFHAQPLACPVCGPQLYFHQQDIHRHDTSTALTACIQALREGNIVAVKGIGGYHLFCAADNDTAVLRLRDNKPRPAKPLAVMFPWQGPDGLAAVKSQVTLEPAGIALLCDPQRPILLARKSSKFSLSPQIAPNLTEIGVMLPYSPLHHLLLTELATPLIATSANISGEPVLTDNTEVEQRLGHVAEAFLHHNRPIVRPADDSVFRMIAGKPRPLRLGRGKAPLELTLPINLPQPLLAVGAHLKNTIALAWQNRVVISPHIGDLDSPRSLDIFVQLSQDLQKLYHIQATTIVCDAHPHYANTRWAKQSGLPVIPVFHHHAHASALAGEFPNTDPWLIFTWDGVGFGEDGTFWGGEALYGHPGQWQRVASFRPFALPGGDKSGREPWRSALALCWETNHPWDSPPTDTTLLYHAWQQGLNCPPTTAVGRLFDAAAALTGLLHYASFEGQGPMRLEAVCTDSTTWIDLPLQQNSAGLWQTDWAPLLDYLLDNRLSVAERATGFHNSLAFALVAQAQQIRADYAIGQVGLCGGVFQNRYLTEKSVKLLNNQGFTVYLPQQLPGNDAGISFGQIIEVAVRKERIVGLEARA
jgi:hydrogenase maturation protein HypF